MKKGLLLCFSLYALFLPAQDYDPTKKPNTYASKANPNYWKNKMPFLGYWQQDVAYQIKANIDETIDVIQGNLKLTYWNNSPDDLPFVYFHLYQNAFQPESHYHDLYRDNKREPTFGKYEKEKKGTVIKSLKVQDFSPELIYDNTVVKVMLDKPLKSGDNITFDIVFDTYFDTGEIRRRMKKFSSSGHTHYDGVHWYPRISVYDRKFGWTTDQHLGREFYGDFGCFDVELTFSDNYVVEATGKLLNDSEVLPRDLKEKLRLENFKDKPWGEKASEITPYDPNKRKTWKYHAENVHDFAFTADPTYRIGEAYWKDVKCVALVQEPHASKWQNAADYTARIIKTFSEDIGMYQYNKMVVADARDGMEYPMITLDGGKDPSYRGLLVHEVGHNWFYGQVGTNETYRAFMDEGFTQFLTAWGLEAIDGDTLAEDPPVKTYHKWFKEPTLAKDRRVYYGYLSDAIRHQDAPLNTHSDDFGSKLRHGGGYRHVYYKTATMLYNLQYVLGDQLFLEAMKHYFSAWKMAHPYPEDFRNSVIQFTGVDLNWFFDQWLETTKNIDYKFKTLRKVKAEQGVYQVRFKRKGEMQMPLDFSVEDVEGKRYDFHIPNTWFEKKTNAVVLPKWTGWSGFNTDYTTTIALENKPKHVHIDPSNRLADINMLNNHNRLPSKFSFDHHLYEMPSRTHYQYRIRPDMWYNAYDGVKMGLHLNGDYMKVKHVFDFNLWANTMLFQDDKAKQLSNSAFINYNPSPISYRLNYSTPLLKIAKGSRVFMSSKYLDGLFANTLGLSFDNRKRETHFSVYFKSMHRAFHDAFYLFDYVYPLRWQLGNWNNTLNLTAQKKWAHFNAKSTLDFALKTSMFTSHYDYSYVNATYKNIWHLNKTKLRTRIFAQLGMGNRWANESMLLLEGANLEAQMENKFTRSAGVLAALDVNPTMRLGGGLNLRGYFDNLATQFINDQNTNVMASYASTSGMAVNLEYDFLQMFKRSKKVDLWMYGFADAGTVRLDNQNSNRLYVSDLRADAGLGLAYTQYKFGPLQTVKPLTFRVDFPMFLNRIPFGETNYFDFRWVIGIERAF